MNRLVARRWWIGPLFGMQDIGGGDVALALLLSAFGVKSTSGLAGALYPHQGLAASLAVLVMTMPVVFARRYPLATAAMLAAGAALNWGAIGDMVRCGAALPAVFYVAYTIGSRCTRWTETVLGTALLTINLTCQAYSDPQLGPEVLEYMVPIALGFTVAGRLLQGHEAIVARLRDRTAELRDQREQNARLAVVAEQARIADGLDGFLQERIGQIAAAAATGQATLAAKPDNTRDTFIAIQGIGRETLTHMRGIVTNLRNEAPTEPQPVIAQLDRLLVQSTQARTRLQVTGDPRLLPPGVELTGYRIVEHLLVALDNDPTVQIDVAVHFGPDALEVTVAGPSARHSAVQSALAAATERAALHGGTLRTQARAGRREMVVLLPLVGGRA